MSAVSKRSASDLREFLAALDERGWLTRIDQRVGDGLELASTLYQLQQRGQAAVFERVWDSAFKVAGNVIVNRDMLALALGCARDDTQRLWLSKLRQRIEPRLVDGGPVKEVRLTGDEARLSALPIVQHAAKDAGPYITAGVVITRDPDSGKRNLSFNRMMYRSEREAGMRMMPSQQLGQIQNRVEQAGRPLEVAVAIGLHPCQLLAAAASLPPGDDELALAGALHDAPVELVKCETVDLEAPAAAEIVLEGEILPGVREPEGPFGDFMQFYTPVVESNVFRLRAITHRRGAYYHTIHAGTDDDMSLLAPSREAEIFEAIERAGSRVKTLSLMPTILGCVIAIEKRYEGEAKNVAMAAFGAYRWLKVCVVVDHDVDVFNMSDVWWAMVTRGRADTGVFVIADAMGFPRERDPFMIHQGKLGIDATIPLGQWEHFERKTTPGS
jgi:2,5-furandicarboxylate decarboxylase 1